MLYFLIFVILLANACLYLLKPSTKAFKMNVKANVKLQISAEIFIVYKTKRIDNLARLLTYCVKSNKCSTQILT